MAIIKIPYTDEADKQRVISENTDKRIAGDWTHNDGNWLLFDDQPFDLSEIELRMILAEIIDQFNVLRTHPAIDLQPITYEQARDAIKTRLGL